MHGQDRLMYSFDARRLLSNNMGKNTAMLAQDWTLILQVKGGEQSNAEHLPGYAADLMELT